MSSSSDFATQTITASIIKIVDQLGATWDSAWQAQMDLYTRWWAHYSGESLKEKSEVDLGVDGEEVNVTPLRINLAKKYANIHAMLIFGAGLDINNPVMFNVTSLTGSKIDDKDRWNEIFRNIWVENKWRVVLDESTRIFQALGGFYWKVVHDDSKYNGVRIELIAPQWVYPIFDSSHNIIEVYVAYPIGLTQAMLEYGYHGSGGAIVDEVMYLEHWTRDKWEIRIGEEGEVAYDMNTGNPLSGRNEYGIVPFFYVSRNRTNSNYGWSMIEDLIGIMGELNERGADIGDAIGEETHRRLFARNWTGPRDGRGRIILDAAENEVIDTGSNPSGTPEPVVWSMEALKIPDTTLDFLKWLEQQNDDVTLTAPVIFGKDEGSQRSGETLTARALPTVAQVNKYRLSYAQGFEEVARQSLRCMLLLGKNDVTERDLSLSIETSFWPILPRDKTRETDETIKLHQDNLISTETALKHLRTVTDIEDEIMRIQSEMLFKSQLQRLSRERMTPLEETQTVPEEGSSNDGETKTPTISSN